MRVGDKSMKNGKPGLIDYAILITNLKFDILLAANSKFVLQLHWIFSIACLFDVPVILTNTSHSIVYFRLKKDFFVPSLLKNKALIR